MNRRAAAITLVLMAAVGPTVAANHQIENWTLPTLMRAMARISSATARFTEERHLHYLNEPIRSSGRLVYEAPSYLERRVFQPEEETVTIDGDRLTIQSSGGGRSTSARVSDYPALGALTNAIITVMAGDLDTLQDGYAVRFSSNDAKWELALSPREQRIRDAVQELRVEGFGNRITLIEIKEMNGNRTIMLITVDQ